MKVSDVVNHFLSFIEKNPLTNGLITCIIIIILGALAYMLTKLLTAVAKIKAQFKPNGGSSLKDAFDRLEKNQDLQLEIIKQLDKRTTTLEHALNDKKR